MFHVYFKSTLHLITIFAVFIHFIFFGGGRGCFVSWGFFGGCCCFFVIIHISYKNKRNLTNRNNQMLIHCLVLMSFNLFVLYRWRSFHQMGTSPLPRQRFRRTLFRFVKNWNTCNISPANINIPGNETLYRIPLLFKWCRSIFALT